MEITIARERADTSDARMLMAELDALIAPLYAVDDRYGYSVDKLVAQNVAFFVMRLDTVPAGCGGIQFFEEGYSELKRIYIRPQFRNRGLGRRLVEHLENFSRANAINIVRLETGIHQTDAIRLYEDMGYHRIPPFGDYPENDVSRCYEKHFDLVDSS
jgi:ribosomal protein S18 acetylase RimI-like enzyme